MTEPTTLHRAWRPIQSAVAGIGLAILVLLVAAPELGIHAFWNILIPVAPALLVFGPGLWRNVCPLASTALLPRHLDRSSRLPLSLDGHGRLCALGIAALFLIVPLRHVVLDTDGLATALTLAIIAAVAVTVGFVFDWRSGWCSSLCPVHAVERLYGSRPIASVTNAHCHSCANCVSPCPDLTKALTPQTAVPTRWHRWSSTLLVGGFAGFIWGWFQVPDYANAEGWDHLGTAYGWPLLGTLATLALYLGLRRGVAERHHQRIDRLFAAAAVSCYYWYRLPALVGFGPYPGDGMLVDLSTRIPAAVIEALPWATTSLFVWWLVLAGEARRSWALRPPGDGPALLPDVGVKSRK